MDFSAPSEADVDMAIHDDALLDINLAAQYAPGGAGHGGAGHGGAVMGNGLADAFIAGMIPGVAPLGSHQQPGGHHPQQPQQANQLHAQPQGYSSVEEYAALMGIKLENNQEEIPTPMGHLQNSMNQFNVQQSSDPAKIQANAAYFENLYRERANMIGGDVNGNITSMTLPAGVGSGMNPPNMYQQSPSHPNGAVYDRSTELAYNQMNQRMYDPTSGFAGNSPAAPVPVAIHKPATHRVVQQHAMHNLGAQTLSPELLSAMIKTNNQAMHNYDNLSEEERAALAKEEKSRERNRDHSRKSRQRKKEYVENLKQEVQQLQIYQQICEHSQDLIAMITADPKALFIYTSASHGRVIGFQPHHLVPGQTSFLDLVHPDQVAEVRNVIQRLENVGDSSRFRFRIKSAEGEYFDAETVARKADTSVVCSTRVNRDF